MALLETVIALAILAMFAFAIIQVFRQNSMRGENFSSEHFTAMFVCQKVLEDINTRVQENPHFFNQLVASATGDPERVVDGQSPYFDLLENTINFSYLDAAEDRPIDAQSEIAYRQLKDFRCQVECRLDVPSDPDTGQPYRDLIEVIVSVFWKDVSGEQKYSVSQYLRGVSRTTYENLDSAQLKPISEADAGWGLWWWLASGSTPSSPTFASFMTFNGGGDPQVVKPVGDLVYFTLNSRKIQLTFANLIRIAETDRDRCLGSADPEERKKASLYQERIGQLYEQQAAMLFSLAGRLVPSVEFLLGTTLDSSRLGNRVSAAGNSLRGRCWSVSVSIEEIRNGFAAAEHEYLRLLEAPFKAGFPERKVTPTIRKILDLEKLGVMIRDLSGTPGNSLNQVQDRIRTFQGSFQGMQPLFLEYLGQEAGICRSVDSLKAYYGGDAGLSGLIRQVMELQDEMFTLERKIP